MSGTFVKSLFVNKNRNSMSTMRDSSLSQLQSSNIISIKNKIMKQLFLTPGETIHHSDFYNAGIHIDKTNVAGKNCFGLMQPSMILFSKNQRNTVIEQISNNEVYNKNITRKQLDKTFANEDEFENHVKLILNKLMDSTDIVYVMYYYQDGDNYMIYIYNKQHLKNKFKRHIQLTDKIVNENNKLIVNDREIKVQWFSKLRPSNGEKPVKITPQSILWANGARCYQPKAMMFPVMVDAEKNWHSMMVPH